MKNFFFVISLLVLALGLLFWRGTQTGRAHAVKAQATTQAARAYLDALTTSIETGEGAGELSRAESDLVRALRDQFPYEDKFEVWSMAPGRDLTHPAAQSIARFRTNLLDGEVGP